MTAPAVPIATTPPTDRAWMARAGCAGHASDPSPWDAPSGTPLQRVAARWCLTRCQVQPVCAAWALTHPREQGTWGGLSEPERQRLRQAHPQLATENRSTA